MAIMLEVKNMYKSFPGVNALTNVSFFIRPGVAHVLCGENGAGKSTIMKILNGVHQPDQGDIFLDSKKITLHSPIEARDRGIAMIFQELYYVPEMSIAEFMVLGSWPTKRFHIDWKRIYQETEVMLTKEKLLYNPHTKLKHLSISDIQILEILKAVNSNARIIIMDEPTSAITQHEVDRLLQKITVLKHTGKSILYVSHKMDEIFRIADDITILRDGHVIKLAGADEFNSKNIIKLMIGRELVDDYPKQPTHIGETLLEVEGLDSEGIFHDVGFHINKGEIVGFAGLMGAGRTEIVRAVCGLDPYDKGTIRIHSKIVSIKNVRDSIRNGIAMLSEDRRRYGLIPIRSVKENVSISNLKQYIYNGYLHAHHEIQEVTTICNIMNVKTPSIETSVDALSGGNQQKIVLAKWAISKPDVFIMDEPTRGIDVGAKYEIYKLMQTFVDEGKGILMVSSELPELLGMCDRMYVICNGQVAGEVSSEKFSSDYIMHLATGVHNEGHNI